MRRPLVLLIGRRSRDRAQFGHRDASGRFDHIGLALSDILDQRAGSKMQVADARLVPYVPLCQVQVPVKWCPMLTRLLLFISLDGFRLRPATDSPDWTKPFPPFKILGNIYWVGTWDLSTYLIATPRATS